MKEEKDKKPIIQVISIIIGAAASGASLIGNFYLFNHRYGILFAGLFCSLEEVSRIKFLYQWRKGIISSAVIYFFVSGLILSVNVASFDYWHSKNRQVVNHDIESKIARQINLDFDRQIQEVKNEINPKIAELESHVNQNMAIKRIKGIDSYGGLADDRQQQIEIKKKELRQHINELIGNRTAALSENLTPGRIKYYMKRYGLESEKTETGNAFEIYGLDDSFAGKLLAALMAVLLEVLILKSFFYGIKSGKITKGKETDFTNQDLIFSGANLIEKIGKNQELIDLIARLMRKYKAGAWKSSVNMPERELYGKLREIADSKEVKNAKKKMDIL